MTNTEHDTATWYERYGELTRRVFLEGEDALPENDRVFLERMDAAMDCLGLR
jgi:hypothetical protein